MKSCFPSPFIEVKQMRVFLLPRDYGRLSMAGNFKLTGHGSNKEQFQDTQWSAFERCNCSGHPKKAIFKFIMEN